MALVFVELAQDSRIGGGSLDHAISRDETLDYKEGYLKSVVDDPLSGRRNTGTNAPTIVYADVVSGGCDD
jgi:tartrate dehydratase alpha subunit/fumarate hydratase class I-like protein